LHAMPSAPRHVALRRHARHRISPAQGGCGTRRVVQRGAACGIAADNLLTGRIRAGRQRGES
jgi:hypothetical protein